MRLLKGCIKLKERSVGFLEGKVNKMKVKGKKLKEQVRDWRLLLLFFFFTAVVM